MRSNRLKLLVIFGCLLLASLPPLAFVHFLQGHAYGSAEGKLRGYADRMVQHLEATIDEGVLALTTLQGLGATACDDASIRAMRRAIFDTYVLREIAVIDENGAIQCADSIFKTDRWVLSRLPSVNERIDLAIVVDEESARRSVAIQLAAGDGRSLIAHFAPDSLGLDVLPDNWRSGGHARVSLGDGTVLQTMPQQLEHRFDDQSGTGGGDIIEVAEASNRYPLRIDLHLSRDLAMRDFGTLRAFVIVLMLLYSGFILAAGYIVVRRKPTPSDDLEYGIRRGEFLPYYQPVINLANGRLEGCEVLIRRRRPDGSIETPASFIAQAEMDGQIVPMTRQLMRTVRDDLGAHLRHRPQLTVAFNLCACHFADEEIIGDLKDIFSDSDIRYSQIVLEVTERLPLENPTLAVSIIDKLQALGARVALDDAGTGHSGLATLQRLGMDIVKIDKLFIDAIDAETRQAPIVDSLVDLANTFGMGVVAEGVETLDQVNYLRSKGVGFAQGYLFAPPLPKSSFIALIEAMAKSEEQAKSGGQPKAA